MFMAMRVNGAILFEDDFDTYSGGQLVGQGGWTGNTGTTVSSGQVQPFTNGVHDSVQHTLNVAHTAGETIYFSFEIQDADDDSYVNGLALGTDTNIAWTGESSAARVGIAGNTFKIKLNGEAGSGITPQDGESYLLVARLEFDASGNETLTLWVDPESETDTPLVTHSEDLGWTQVTHVALAATNHDGLNTVSLADNVAVTTSFEDIIPTEPATRKMNPFTAFDQVSSDYVMVVAHRHGYISNGNRIFAENSLAAAAYSIELGVDMLETDVRMTSDGGLVVMHDSTVSRTTNGSGTVSSMTLAQVTALKLKGPGDILTDENVPTLAQLMILARGKILVNLDKITISDVALRNKVMETLIATDTVDHAVFKGGDSAETVAAFRADYPEENIIFRPNLSNATESTVINMINSHSPPGITLNFSDASTEMLSTASLAAAANNDTHIWMNTLWSSQCAGHHDAVALAGNPDGSWGWCINKGATMIQTDNAPQLIPYLESIGMRGTDLPPLENILASETGPFVSPTDHFFAIDHPLTNGSALDDIVANSGSLFLRAEVHHGGDFCTLGLFPAASGSTSDGAVAFGRNNDQSGFASFNYLDHKGAPSETARSEASPLINIIGGVYTLIAEVRFDSATTGTLRGWIDDGTNTPLDLNSPHIETNFSNGFSTSPDHLYIRIASGSTSSWANIRSVWVGDDTGATRENAFTMLDPSQTYSSWAIQNFAPSQSLSPQANADSDNQSNQIEYYMGSDPNDPSSQGALRVLNHTTPEIEYSRSKNRPDVTGELKWSPDLANWYASGESDGIRTIKFTESVVSSSSSDPELIRASSQATTGAFPERLFIHLEVK